MCKIIQFQTLDKRIRYGYNKEERNERGVNMKMKKRKTIALIAHDNKKADIVNWALKNKETLAKFDLCGTGTTARLIGEATDLPIKRYLSGPLGGDQQIGAKVAEKKIDVVIFFWDPLSSQPHDPDVKALLRIAVVYDIPIATNRATADYVIHSNMLE